LIFMSSITMFFIVGCSDKTSKLENECDNGIALSCHDLGEIYENGSEYYEVEKNLTKAVSFHKKGCDKGYSESCLFVGDKFNFGFNGERNVTQAIGFYDKACKENNAIACSRLGARYFAQNDYKKGIEYYEYACNNGNEESCEYIGRIYLEGDKVKEDLLVAMKYFNKVFNTRGCFFYDNLGYRYDKGMLNNKLNAKKSWKLGCDVNCSRSCSNLGITYANEKNYEKAKEFLTIACDANAEGSASACLVLGQLYETKKILNVKNSPKELYRKACNNTDEKDAQASMEACILLGM